jgi:hypothetical protein
MPRAPGLNLRSTAVSLCTSLSVVSDIQEIGRRERAEALESILISTREIDEAVMLFDD